MTISIITLFPELFRSVFDYSITKRAQQEERVKIRFINIRDFGIGKRKIVDDKPYGGGAGMVLRVDVLDKAIQSARLKVKNEKVVLLDPKGQKYDQNKAQDFSKLDHLILLCGHYEGFDDRVRNFVDEEISIGDYVLSGGEIGAIVVADSVIRLIPGVLRKEEATSIESFSRAEGKIMLEYAQYTRPEEYKGLKVPHILLEGNHKEIEKFRRKESEDQTKRRRPDLLEKEN